MSATGSATSSPEVHPTQLPPFAKTARPLPPFHSTATQHEPGDAAPQPITLGLADSVVRILVDVIVAGQKLDKAISHEFHEWSSQRPHGAAAIALRDDEAEDSDTSDESAIETKAEAATADRHVDRAEAAQHADNLTSSMRSPSSILAEQGLVVMLVGDILRRLNFYCALHDAELCSALIQFYEQIATLPPAALQTTELQQAAQALDAMVLEKAGTVLRWHGRVLLDSWAQLQDWPRQLLPSTTAASQWPARYAQLQHHANIMDGCPAWLALRASAEFNTSAQAHVQPDDDLKGAVSPSLCWAAERAAMAYAAPRFVRANLLKTTPTQLMARLTAEGIESHLVQGVETALWIRSDSALFRSRAFADGLFEQQDAGSQLVAAMLPVAAGQRVIDACAGAGGKALALAARMQAKGKVLALDIEAWKLETLAQRAKRAAAHSIETRLITGTKTIKRLVDSADRLLLDVPCSGSGVLRRNPDGKWRDAGQSLAELLPIQADILQRYSKMLRPNGYLLYATCSIFPSENRQQIDKFLAAHPHFKLLEDCTISTAETGFDGFYYALLQRVETTAS
jgi:16S rRNA (cytosine967-C5)-methyltransferase